MQRDPWFDNAKMALVTLVVVGHALALLPGGAARGHGYDFLYSWHIPAFVFVTGYLSRSFAWEGRRVGQLVRTVAVPYVVFEGALAAFRILVGGERLEDLWVQPHWGMWFLPALFFWRLMTPLFTPLRGAVALAVVVSLVAGKYADDPLDLARVLGLLPFFVLGLRATPDRLELLRTRGMRIAAVGVFAGIWLLTSRTDQWATTEWLYYRTPYDDLGVDDGRAVLTRAGLLVLGTLGTLAFLALVPRVSGWFTRMGAATLLVYLFHLFFVKAAAYAGFGGWAGDHPVLGAILAVVGGVGLSLLLACEPVSSWLRHLVDPVGFAQAKVTHAHELRVAATEAEVLAEAVHQAARQADQRSAQLETAGR